VTASVVGEAGEDGREDVAVEGAREGELRRSVAAPIDQAQRERALLHRARLTDAPAGDPHEVGVLTNQAREEALFSAKLALNAVDQRVEVRLSAVIS